MKFNNKSVSQVRLFALFTSLVIAFLSVSVSASPTREYSGGQTSVTLSPELIAAAGSLNLHVGGISPARRFGNAGFSFPITSGLIDLENARGEIIHSGGLRLSAGGTRADLRNFIIDTTGAQPLLTGVAVVNNTVVGRIPLFKLNLPELSLPLPNRTPVLFVPNVGLRLTAEAAGALNQIFGVTAFTEDFPVGTAQVRAFSFNFPGFPPFVQNGAADGAETTIK